MKTVLLAGGVSSRLWPLQADKNFWPFYPDNLLTHNLKTLQACGLNDIILICNPVSLEKAKKNIAELDFKVEIVEQPTANGIGQGLLLAQELIKDQPLLVLNCDDIVEPGLLTQVVNKAKEGKTDIILAGKKVATYFDGGYFKLKDTDIAGVVEKPGDGREPSEWVKLVVDYYRSSDLLLTALRAVVTEKDDHYETALDCLLQEKTSQLIRYEGAWLTVKYPWQLLDVMTFFLDQIKEPRIDPSAKISPRAVIEGPVVIESGVTIFENAKVKGPVYLGKDVVIANNALVRESYISAGCVVGFASEVARSYLGPDCWTHNNFVGDSILEKNVSFGVGTVLTNLRLDEKEIHSVVKGKKINTGRVKLGAIIGRNVRIGSNSVVMPGVKIGSGASIGAGVNVGHDLEENQFLSLKQEQIIKPNGNPADATDRSLFKGKI